MDGPFFARPSLHISNSRTKPAGLDIYSYYLNDLSRDLNMDKLAKNLKYTNPSLNTRHYFEKKNEYPLSIRKYLIY